MCTEKLAKAYYRTDLRTGHAAFRRFLTDLPLNTGAVKPLGFADLAGLTRWQGSVAPIVGAIEDLAPPIADRLGLPNPEYPWPRGAETNAPADHSFQAEVYAPLDAQARSGEPPFLTILARMVRTMQTAGWHLCMHLHFESDDSQGDSRQLRRGRSRAAAAPPRGDASNPHAVHLFSAVAACSARPATHPFRPASSRDTMTGLEFLRRRSPESHP